MLVIFLFHKVQVGPQTVLGFAIDLSACDHIALAVLAGSEDMGHEHDVNAPLPDKEVDQVVYQTTIVRSDFEHIAACITSDVKEPADIQPHQRDAPIVFSHPGRYFFGTDMRFEREPHVVCEPLSSIFATGKSTDCL